MVPKWKPELKLDLMETFPQRSPLLRNSFLSFLWQSLGLNLEKLVQMCIRYIQAGGECPNHSSSVRLWGLCPVTRLMKVKLNFFIWWGNFLLMGGCFGLIWFRTLTEDASVSSRAQIHQNRNLLSHCCLSMSCYGPQGEWLCASRTGGQIHFVVMHSFNP